MSHMTNEITDTVANVKLSNVSEDVMSWLREQQGD